MSIHIMGIPECETKKKKRKTLKYISLGYSQKLLKSLMWCGYLYIKSLKNFNYIQPKRAINKVYYSQIVKSKRQRKHSKNSKSIKSQIRELETL
jgi:hypothetical protein